MKLEDKLRHYLLGHLSDDNTETDVTIASLIVREFAVSFSVFVAENYTIRRSLQEVFREFLGRKRFNI